jgi:hypothetical protein
MFAALNQPVPPEATGGGRGGRGGRNAQNPSAMPGAGGSPLAAPPSPQSAGPNGGGTGSGNGNQNGDGQARILERFKNMAPGAAAGPKTRATGTGSATGPGSATAQGASTIDALFAPLPPVESRGRAWLYMDKQLKPVQLRLGITDGTNTELLSGELQPGMELVTGIIMSGSTARPTASGGSGNPLMPNRGGGPGRGR